MFFWVVLLSLSLQQKAAQALHQWCVFYSDSPPPSPYFPPLPQCSVPYKSLGIPAPFSSSGPPPPHRSVFQLPYAPSLMIRILITQHLKKVTSSKVKGEAAGSMVPFRTSASIFMSLPASQPSKIRTIPHPASTNAVVDQSRVLHTPHRNRS